MIRYIQSLACGVALALVGLGLGSCAHTTEVESLGIRVAEVERDHPEAYAQYLEALRAYKQSAHTKVYTWFDNSLKTPSSRAHHFSDLPDSVDVISLLSPDLAAWEVEEMATLRQKKGTKVIYTISFEEISNSYINKLEAATEDQPYEVTFDAFLADSIKASLALADKYQYDGLCVGFVGKATTHMREEELVPYAAYRDMFFSAIQEWRAAHPNSLLAYMGKPQNAPDTEMIKACDAVFVWTEPLTNQSQLTYHLQTASLGEATASNLGVVVRAPREGIKGGVFSNGVWTLDALAEWAPTDHGSYHLSAVGIYDPSIDYHTPGRDYDHLRRAIAMINPPIK